jgi:magnesium-transporting ATPase (P-type)
MCAIKFAHIGKSLADIRIYEVVEKSYDPQAEIKGLSEATLAQNTVIRDIAIVCALNNKAGIVYDTDNFNKLGEPTEAALKVFAEKVGQYDKTFKRAEPATKNPEGYTQFLAAKYPSIATLDFTSERKTMSTVVKGLSVSGKNSLLVKGAPERVIDKCVDYKMADGIVARFSDKDKKELVVRIEEFARQGLRVLGLGMI